MRRGWTMGVALAGAVGAGAVTLAASGTTGPRLDAAARPKPDLPKLPAHLTVTDYGPRGDLEGRDAPSIHVRFNQPVTTLGGRGEKRDANLLRLDPPVPGRSLWRAPDLLVFEPRSPLPVATRIRVTLETPVHGLEGRRYAEPLSWELETRRPVIDRWSLADGALIGASEAVVLQFSVPVSLAKVRQALRIDVGTDTPSSFDVARPTRAEDRPDAPDENGGGAEGDEALEEWRAAHEHRVAIRPRAPWPLGAKLGVTVAATVLTPEGNLPMQAQWRRTFQVQTPPALESATCADAPGPLRITLSTPLPAGARAQIKISPPLAPWPELVDAEGSLRWSRGRDVGGHFRVLTAGPARADVTYRITLPAGVTDAFGQTTSTASQREVRCAPPRPGLALVAPSGILEAEKPRIIGVEGRGVDRFIVRAVALDHRALGQVRWPFGDNDFLPQAHSVGLPVVQKTITTERSGPTQWSATAVDLGPMVKSVRRPVLVEIEPVTPLPEPAGDSAAPDRRRALYQITDLGILAFRATGRSVVQVVRLSTGKPVPGAYVLESPRTGSFEQRGRADAHGLVFIDASPVHSPSDGDPIYLVQTADGKDMAVVRAFGSGDAYRGRPVAGLAPGEEFAGTFIPDRQSYAPGDEIGLVGWLAISTPFDDSGLRRIEPGMPVVFRLRHGNITTIQESFVATHDNGKVWARMTVPAGAALGWYSLDAQVGRARAEEREDYMGQRWGYLGPVTIQVAARSAASLDLEGSADRTDVLRDGPVHISARAIDRDAPGAPARLVSVRTQVLCESGARRKGSESTRVLSVDNAAARAGMIELEAHAPWWDASAPTYCRVTIAVRDASARQATTTLGFTAHAAPAQLRIEPRPLLDARVGDPLSVAVSARSYDGKRVGVKGATLGLRGPAGDMKQWRVDVAGDGPITDVPLPALPPGRYEVTVKGTALQSQPAPATASLEVHENMVSGVGGLERFREPLLRRSVPVRDILTLSVPDGAAPGQPLPVTLAGPKDDLEGLLVVSRGGVRQALPFALRQGRARVVLEPTDAWVPDVRLEAVALVPGAPARLIGDARIAAVSPRTRELAVDLGLPAQARPGESIEVTVRVKGLHDGAPPAPGGVAVWAVDERTALTQLAPLVSAFFARTGPSPLDHPFGAIARPYQPAGADRYLPLSEPLRWLDVSAMPAIVPVARRPRHQRAGLDAEPNGTMSSFFQPDVALGADGTARLRLPVPRGIDQLRVIALASAPQGGGTGVPGRFGVSEARVRIRTPLALALTLPGRLRPGDDTEMTATLKNDTDAAGIAIIKVRIEGARAAEITGLMSPAAAQLSLARGQTQQATFRLRALGAGAVSIRAEAELSPESGTGVAVRDSDAVPLVVAPPTAAPPEVVAVYGAALDGPEVIVPVRLSRSRRPPAPGDRIEIELSSIVGGNLAPAIAEVLEPSHDCLEQVASRLVPLLTFPELTKRGLGRDARAFVREVASHVLAFAAKSGEGSGHWPASAYPDPYASAYAAIVLQKAREAGYLTDERNPGEGRYLELLLEEPKWLEGPRRATDAVKAMALLALAGMERWEEDTQTKMDDLYVNRRALAPAAQAFLLLALHRRNPRDARIGVVQSVLEDAVVETAPGTATVTGGRALVPGYVSGQAAFSEAVVLWALARTGSPSALVPKLARGLVEHRRGVGWGNGHDSAFALFALSEFARRPRANQDVDLVVDAFAGGRAVQTGVGFKSQPEATLHTGAIALSDLPPTFFTSPGAPGSITIKRRGQGPLFYGVRLVRARDSPPEGVKDRGLSLQRVFRAGPGGRAIDAARAGDTLVMDVILRSRAPLRHVAIEVPLPAGLVPLHPAQAAGAPVTWWVSHQEQHPDRLTFFADELPPGEHGHSVTLRATTPGRYLVPAGRAFPTYLPDVRAETPAGVFVVSPTRSLDSRGAFSQDDRAQ